MFSKQAQTNIFSTKILLWKERCLVVTPNQKPFTDLWNHFFILGDAKEQ
jgi:hypothetical protein